MSGLSIVCLPQVNHKLSEWSNEWIGTCKNVLECSEQGVKQTTEIKCKEIRYTHKCSTEIRLEIRYAHTNVISVLLLLSSVFSLFHGDSVPHY